MLPRMMRLVWTLPCLYAATRVDAALVAAVIVDAAFYTAVRVDAAFFFCRWWMLPSIPPLGWMLPLTMRLVWV